MEHKQKGCDHNIENHRNRDIKLMFKDHKHFHERNFDKVHIDVLRTL